MALSTADVPTQTQLDPIVGETTVHTLYGLSGRRLQEVVFYLAKLTIEKYFRDETTGNGKHWLFPQLVTISRRWLEECLICKDNTFPQMLLLAEPAHDAVDKMYRALLPPGADRKKTLKPILTPYDTVGSTEHVDFDTSKEVYPTSHYKCHVSHVVADSNWEHKMAEALEDMVEVKRYVKNQSLGFTIPYTIGGVSRNYLPDFIACIDDGMAPDNLLNLIIEVTGEKKKDKEAKVATARSLWVPAINNHGGFGRWGFIEISDPWNAKTAIRAKLEEIGDVKGAR